MKIALVSDWYHPRVGGIERHLEDLAARLVLAGHDVVVITPTPGPALVDGIRVRRIDAPRAPVFGFLCTPAGVRAIGTVLTEETPDVAHCHVSIVSPAALGGAREAVRRRIATLLTFHSIVPRTPWLARAVNSVLRTSSWPVRFSAVSRLVANEVAPIAGVHPIALLSNGVDVEFWRAHPGAAAQPSRDDDVVRLTSVMRLNAKKRPLALVGLMERLRTLCPHRQVRLDVVGDGPLRAELERRIARRGLVDRVKVRGRRSREEIRTLFGETDLFVLPTVRESFGLAALEARCAGIPVVAMRASGVAEMIAHDREGLLADSDADLAIQTAALIADPERRARIAQHNTDTAPPCDWSTVVDANVALYREAIALRPKV